jgi:hypothetical protein
LKLIKTITIVRCSNILSRACLLIFFANTQGVEFVGKLGLVFSLSALIAYVFAFETSVYRIQKLESMKNLNLKSKMELMITLYLGSMFLLLLISGVIIGFIQEFNIVYYALILSSVDLLIIEFSRVCIIKNKHNVSALILFIRYTFFSVCIALLSLNRKVDISFVINLIFYFSILLIICFSTITFIRKIRLKSSGNILYTNIGLRWIRLLLKKSIITTINGFYTRGFSTLDRSVVATFSNDKILGYYVLFTASVGAIITVCESETTTEYITKVSKVFKKDEKFKLSSLYIKKHMIYIFAFLVISYFCFYFINEKLNYIHSDIYLNMILVLFYFIVVSLINSLSLVLTINGKELLVNKIITTQYVISVLIFMICLTYKAQVFFVIILYLILFVIFMFILRRYFDEARSKNLSLR